MKFVSTRGKVEPCGFTDAFLMGLADDGGLMIPESIPQISASTLQQWGTLSYRQLMLEIFSLFTGKDIPREDLEKLIERSYEGFRSPEVAPVRRIRDSLYIMELFHGPTFAFKDVALQFIGNLYEYVSNKRGEIIHILGATSGDTGAAAIEGVRSKKGVRICILHPHGKVSKVQELQMTTVNDGNVLNLSVKGNFDDCQRVIKELFADLDFKNKHHLRAVNSINIVRILAQTVYYFYAYFQVARQAGTGEVSFSVPTGNFGNIFSGYLAKRMGLPIGKLVLATNENNILERFVKEGVYRPGEFRSTHSPSMDIQIASNFERYLYYLMEEDADAVASVMEQFGANGGIELDPALLQTVQSDFYAYGVSNDECLATLRRYETEYGYLPDPHSSCGIAACEAYGADRGVMVALATAHPAKFDESVRLTGIGQTAPPQIAELFDKPQYQTVIDYSKAEIADRLEQFFWKN